ncbi:Hypothetical predicted protein [Olea europaea subsp. europaea]|uniref:Uncharacterized protein n=1 Tax=Olea europaea subsp. europaea TaxID=158383 RepID=A0A8S0QSU4_OLEEU|nr:Hypothetical predicted protein [Olea europaea subsp. europaea]
MNPASDSLSGPYNDYKSRKAKSGSQRRRKRGGDDLESILRQKALENFRKFQGGLLPSSNASLKIDNESDVNKISSVGANIIQDKSTKQDSSDGACLIRETNYSCMPALKRNLSHHKEIKKDITGYEDVGKVPITNKQNAIHSSDEVALPIPSENEDCTTAYAVISKPSSSTDPNLGA